MTDSKMITSIPRPTHSTRVAALWLAAALAFTPGAALAQDQGAQDPAPEASVDCVPAPLDDGAAGSDPDAAPDAGQPDTTLTEQLDACDGVLTPPAVGDSDIIEPAPAVGETPVIEPEDVPEQ